MKNKELIHFLNSEVKVKFESNISHKMSRIVDLDINNYDFLINISKATPYLYPRTILTETINHEGVDEIPLVELAKIEGIYIDEEFAIDINCMFWRSCSIGITYCFAVRKNILGDIYFESSNVISGFSPIVNQLLLLQYLFSRRINVFNIDAIDPRECSVNPYLIINKK